MSSKSRLLLGLWLFALTGQMAMAAPALTPFVNWLPANTVFLVELARPKALLEPLLDARIAEAIGTQPFYRQLAQNKEFKDALMMVKLMEGIVGTNWQAAVQLLTHGGVTLAVTPPHTIFLSIDTDDENRLGKIHEFIRSIAQMAAPNQGQPSRVASADFQGITTWTFNGQEAHAIIGKKFILCNHLEGLKEILARREAGAHPSLANSPGYQAARQAAGPEAVARGYVNLDILKNAPQLGQLLKAENKSPLGALLFAGLREALADAHWLALSLLVDQERLVLRSLVDGQSQIAEGFAKFARPTEPGSGILPNLSVPRQIAGLSFYRDLHSFYAAKDKLFPDRTSGLIFFENMMGIFFSGRDLTDEVLAQTRPEIRFVVASQKYHPAIGTPEIQFPAFAAVLKLRHPKEFDEVVEEAWQKALGLVNFTRGQQALPGLIMSRPAYQGTTFTAAHYSSVGLKDRTKLHQRYNVSPSLAMPGEYLILSSTAELAQDLMDSLAREKQNPPPPIPQSHSLLELDGRQLAAILEANRDSLVRGNMIKSGKTQEAAQSEVDTILTVVKAFSQVKLSLAQQKNLTEARLEMMVRVP